MQDSVFAHCGIRTFTSINIEVHFNPNSHCKHPVKASSWFLVRPRASTHVTICTFTVFLCNAGSFTSPRVCFLPVLPQPRKAVADLTELPACVKIFPNIEHPIRPAPRSQQLLWWVLSQLITLMARATQIKPKLCWTVNFIRLCFEGALRVIHSL